MKSDATPFVTVGIFEKVEDLKRAVERLAAAGFEDILYDETIVARDTGNVAAVSMDFELVPGVFAEALSSAEPDLPTGSVEPTSPTGSVEPALPTLIQAFKSYLVDYHVPDEVMDDYAMAYYHEGKVVLVKTHVQRDKEAVRILLKCGALQANRFDCAPGGTGAENSA